MVFPPVGSRGGVTHAAAVCTPQHRGDVSSLPRYGKQDTAESHPSAGTRQPLRLGKSHLKAVLKGFLHAERVESRPVLNQTALP